MLGFPTELEVTSHGGNYYSRFGEGSPFGMQVDADPIMIFIEFCDPDGPNFDMEPFDIPTNDLIHKWCVSTGRIPSRIWYDDCTYAVDTKEFSKTRYQWRPDRGQEDWIYTGNKFIRI